MRHILAMVGASASSTYYASCAARVNKVRLAALWKARVGRWPKTKGPVARDDFGRMTFFGGERGTGRSNLVREDGLSGFQKHDILRNLDTQRRRGAAVAASKPKELGWMYMANPRQGNEGTAAQKLESGIAVLYISTLHMIEYLHPVSRMAVSQRSSSMAIKLSI